MNDEFEFEIDDRVEKAGGDYIFRGWIVSRFRKRAINDKAGPVRYVVQNSDGILHIFSPVQLDHWRE